MKGYKTVITILVIYLVLMLILFLPGYLRNRREKLYILSGDFIKIKYEKGTWSNIKDSNDYAMKKFDIFENDRYLGKYKLLVSDRYYIYDEQGNKLAYDGQIFAYNGTLSLSKIDIEEAKPTEEDQLLIEQALTQLKVNSSSYNLFQKVKVDIDKDKTEETIYCLNNYFIESVPDKVYSIVFFEDDGKVTIIKDKVIDSTKLYDSPYYEIKKVLDIKQDQKYELMITENYFGQPSKECVQLYKLYDKKSLITDLCK